jgi:uncharacterized phage protein (TIGR02218 family)
MSIVDSPLSSVAFCWRIERPDGAGLALTSHDQDLVVGGIRFRAAPGILPSAIIRGSGLDPQSGDIAGALTSPALAEEDLVAGRWDGSRVRVFGVDWTDPDREQLGLGDGELGELSYDGTAFSAELRGPAERLRQPVCPETSAQCRAEFGSPECRVDLAGRIVRTSATGINGVEVSVDAELDDRFVFGRLRWLSGPLAGLDGMILSAAGGVVRLREPPGDAGQLPVRVELREGCDKLFATCTTRFDNAANFRGEPHLPGNDLLTRYSGGE